MVTRILAALDFSEVTEKVLDQGERLAEALSAELVLLHVAAPDPEFVGFEAGPETTRQARARELRDEHRRLQEMADALRARGLSAMALLIQGPTVEKILAEAERLGAQFIVIGSHGHGVLHRALLGSVSEGVVRGARCPVHVVPARTREKGRTGSR